MRNTARRDHRHRSGRHARTCAVPSSSVEEEEKPYAVAAAADAAARLKGNSLDLNALDMMAMLSSLFDQQLTEQLGVWIGLAGSVLPLS